MASILGQFLTEARELVEQASAALLAFEHSPDPAHIDAVFRAAHTVKGASGLFEIAPLTHAIHAAEDVLDAARAGRITLDQSLVDVLLETFDDVRGWLDDLEAEGQLRDDAAAIAEARCDRLRACLPRTGGAGVPSDNRPPDPEADRVAAWAEAQPVDRSVEVGAAPLWAIEYRPDPNAFFTGTDPLATVAALPGLRHLEVVPDGDWPPLPELDPFRCQVVIRALVATSEEILDEAFLYVADEVVRARLGADPAPGSEPVRPPPVSARDGATASAIRGVRHLKVDVERVDTLVDLTGELLVAKNALLYLARSAQDVWNVPQLAQQLTTHHALLHRICDELQGSVMEIRMMAFRDVFQRFSRLVRDLSRKQGKEVRLVLEGQETEADKAIVEGLAEPLVHLVRNGIDHGIEPPEERVAAGKPREATLRISARAVGDRVHISVDDDGRGIDPANVRASSVRKGVLTQEAADALSDDEALQLVFLPGLSTRATVTDVSGRGVGMDVVKATVTDAKGSIQLHSELGRGTSVLLTLPLSAAITSIMMVEVAEHTFGLPIEVIRESTRVPRTTFHQVGDGEALHLRDRVLPVLRLDEVLQIHRRADEEKVHEHVVVVDACGQPTALVVDRLIEGMDVIIKPLSGSLRDLGHYLGSTLLGDGSVLLVLDIEEIARCR